MQSQNQWDTPHQQITRFTPENVYSTGQDSVPY